MRILLVTLWHFIRRSKRRIVAYVVVTAMLIALWVIDPLFASFVIDKATALIADKKPLGDFSAYFFLWIAISLFLCVVQAIHKMVCWRILNRVYLSFQEETFAHILHMDVAQHTARRAGAIIKKIDNAADTLWDLGFQIFEVIVPSTFSGVIFLIIAWRVNAWMTAVVATVLALYALVLFTVTKKAFPLQDSISRIWVGTIGRMYDVATNIIPMKSSTGEERELQRLKYWHQRGYALQKRTDRLWGVVEGLNMFMLMRALVVCMGLVLMARNQLSLGQLFFFMFIIFRLITPIEVIGSFLPKWNEKIAKVRMGVFIGKLPSLVKNPENGARPEKVSGRIEFTGVCFSYEKSMPPAIVGRLDEDEDEEIDVMNPHIDHGFTGEHLSIEKLLDMPVKKRFEQQIKDQPKEEPSCALCDVSFTIEPGERIAFVGHSGAGKSTLAALLNRFYDVTSGAILLDGKDIRTLDLPWFRSQIGLVLQENLMFNDTILENIRYSRPEATMGDVIDAAKRAAMHDFITGLAEGYDTEIGERGIRLSGGERQRLAIARAILKRPSIVVLDEATSALDSITERRVQQGINELIAGRTAVIIAHRLSTVRSCNRIAVLAEGKLIAYAPHEELMKMCPTYKEMVELQSHGMLAE